MAGGAAPSGAPASAGGSCEVVIAGNTELVGFEQSVFRIADPEFVATSGKADHAIVRFTGRPDSRVKGTVLEVTERELAEADAYEPAGYERIRAPLASGREAWVYAAARGA